VSESSESNDDEEVPQATLAEVPAEVHPPTASSAIIPGGLVAQTPEGHVEDLTLPEDSEV
jgi:hypothetical protein